MKTTIKAWIGWGAALAASIAGAILLTPAYSVCFFVTMLATLCVFAITGVILAKAGDRESAQSALVGWPLSRVCAGLIVMQMIIALVFVLLSDRCHWLIPCVLECLVLCVDAAALTPKDETKAETSESKEGRAE